MQVTVLFFGMMKEVAGRTSQALELPDGATLADLVERWRADFEQFSNYESSLALSVNQEYAAKDRVLHNGDEVGVLPPVSGGADSRPVVNSSRARIVREPIDAEAVVKSLKYREDGAVVVFDGIVRDNSRGRRTLYLNYEAYDEMALKRLEALASDAVERFGVRDTAVVHRLGRIEIGETSVLIVVASAHRAAAFEACRWMIDTLKKTVPIWKKEYFQDGAVWADGEPFPADVVPVISAGPQSRSGATQE